MKSNAISVFAVVLAGLMSISAQPGAGSLTLPRFSSLPAIGDVKVRVVAPAKSASVDVYVNDSLRGSAEWSPGDFVIVLATGLADGDAVQLRQTVDSAVLQSRVVKLEAGTSLTPLQAKPQAGEKNIKGSAPFVEGAVNGTVNGKAFPEAFITAGKFEIDLSDALLVNQPVHLTARSKDKRLVLDGDFSVAPQDSNFSAEADTVAEGAKEVTGRVTAGDPDDVRVVAYSGTGTDAVRVQEAVVQYDKSIHKFTASFTNPLAETQTLQAYLVSGKDEHMSALGVVASAGYDWGRVKAYFSVGTILVRNSSGNNAGAFSSKLFAGLNVDYNFLSFGKAKAPAFPATKDPQKLKEMKTALSEFVNSGKPCIVSGGSKIDACAAAPGSRPRYFGVNGYFEARLTQVPMQAAGSGTNGSSLDIAQTTGVVLESGIYAPYSPSKMQWSSRGQDNGLFLAPLFKMGFVAEHDNVDSSIPPNSPPQKGISNPRAPDTISRFHAYGVRIGHVKMPTEPVKEAPELLSFLDITGGKWDNFAYQNGGKWLSPWRFDAKGLFKVPLTPIYVGAEANVGRGTDDLRIFVGSRIDMGKLLGKLIPSL